MSAADGAPPSFAPPVPPDSEGGRATLTDEHAMLLEQCARLVRPVLTVAAAGQLPATELRALVDYLRAEVLRQAEDEERLLFPNTDARRDDLRRFSRDHARLHAGVESLSDIADGYGSRSPDEVSALVRGVFDQLDHHLRMEDALLVSPGRSDPVSSTAAVSGRSHEWYSLTEGPSIDLDLLPADHVLDAAVDRLLRLRRGETIELDWKRDTQEIWKRIDAIERGGYTFSCLLEGPERWRLRVTRRPLAS